MMEQISTGESTEDKNRHCSCRGHLSAVLHHLTSAQGQLWKEVPFVLIYSKNQV